MDERTEKKRDEKEESRSTALRITNQFRARSGMAYDLKCDGVRLTLLISERTRADDPGEWRIEAKGSLPGDRTATLVEWGANRSEALGAIAKSWAASTETNGLRVFDWDAVATTLRSVRAL